MRGPLSANRDGGAGASASARHGRRPCDGETLDGKSCGSWALNGSLYCFSHEPGRREEYLESRRRGGPAAAKVKAINGQRKKLDTIPGLVRFTADVIQDTLAETLDAGIARTVLYGLSIQRQLVESSDLDARLRVIEERLALRLVRTG